MAHYRKRCLEHRQRRLLDTASASNPDQSPFTIAEGIPGYAAALMLERGVKFERYTIEAPLGQGGMGHVYRAQDGRLGRRVALKVISERLASPEASARLVREARAAAALDHPNVVAVFDVGEHEGVPFIVMELVDGRTLRETMGDSGEARAPLAARVGWLADAGRALAAAHRKGLVHRDVKPENVMIRSDGVVKVLDFGIARRDSVDSAAPAQALPTLTLEGVKLGTPLYMAPEQIRGDPLDGRADQFSWGVVAYEILAGRLPWRGVDALAAMASVLTDPVGRDALDAASVPRAVQDVVLRALSRRPEDRFASMDDAVRALEAAARGDEPAGVPGPSATAAQLFSTSEVRAVLDHAIERQAQTQGSTKLGFDDLLAVAAEVGIDPDSLREASRALRASKQEPNSLTLDAKKRDAWLRRQRRNFRRHAGIYAIVNAAILVLGLLLLPFTPWWIWFLPALGWGVGLAIHALVAFTADEGDFVEHEQGLQWWEENRRRQHDERMALSEGRWSAAPRARIDPESQVERDRLRVAVDTHGKHEAAEQEAEEAERWPPERQRR
ncbi:MAG: protein kinase [Pseudomonadota bacterium]